MTSWLIKPESDQDYAQIEEIQESAFGQPRGCASLAQEIGHRTPFGETRVGLG